MPFLLYDARTLPRRLEGQGPTNLSKLLQRMGNCFLY
jgi:hypothetical protein